MKVDTPALRALPPKMLAPSLNVTVPVGVPEPPGTTLAVNVTAVPYVGRIERRNHAYGSRTLDREGRQLIGFGVAGIVDDYGKSPCERRCR